MSTEGAPRKRSGQNPRFLAAVYGVMSAEIAGMSAEGAPRKRSGQKPRFLAAVVYGVMSAEIAGSNFRQSTRGSTWRAHLELPS
jgi:hypothetical protein